MRVVIVSRMLLPTVVALAACGGSSGAVVDTSNFTGTAWSGTETFSATCGSLPAISLNSAFSGTFSAEGSDGVTYSTSNGCRFDFTVAGDTATLSNGPVTCSYTTSLGAAVVLSITSFALTTSDGAHLSGTLAATATSGGSNCTVSGTVSGTR
jgi:hypothetical protein